MRLATDPDLDEAAKIAASIAHASSVSAWVDGLMRKELGRLMNENPSYVAMFGFDGFHDDTDSEPGIMPSGEV